MPVSTRAAVALLALVLVPQMAGAQTPSAKPNPYASPLDTIMSTRLWTDVPPAKDFVTESRPDAKTLDYAPLTGKDPDRPKPRDAKGIEALRAELESGVAHNAARSKGLPDPGRTAKPPRHARKPVVPKTTPTAAR